MKKIALLMVFVLIFLAACGQNASAPEQTPSPSANETAPPNDIAPDDVELTIIDLSTIQISILLPDDWEMIEQAGSFLPNVNQSYNFQLVPPDGETFGIVTVGNTMLGQALPAETFTAWHTTLTETILPRAVEESAEFDSLLLRGGSGLFAVFTDAELVGTTPPPDEYLYLGMFLGNWDNGFLAHATLLTNDTESFDFQLMLLALSLMEISFTASEDSFTLADWDDIRAMPPYELTSLNLFGHDLTDSTFLMEYTLESTVDGTPFVVPVITHGEAHLPHRHRPDEVIWDAEGIGMLYYLIPATDVLDLLDLNVRHDMGRLQGDGFTLRTDHPLMTDADNQSAAFGFDMAWDGAYRVTYIYLLQNIPESNYILLLQIMLFEDYFQDEEDPFILFELSERIGINLLAFLGW